MVEKIRRSPKLVLFVVFLAILLDNILLTIIVPIIPEFLYKQTLKLHLLTIYNKSINSVMPMRTFLNSNQDNENNHVRIEESIQKLNETFNFRHEQSYEKWLELIYKIGQNVPSSIKDLNESIYGDKRVKLSFLTSIKPNLTEYRHAILINQNVKVGIMFASKAFVQLITNPFVGALTQRIGYEIPMFCGFIVMFFSTLTFAFSKTFPILLIARAVQGIGSSLSSVSGMSMIADFYTDDKERGSAMAFALSGLAIGVLVGPPFGGVMYEFFGKEVPFLILALLALANGALQLCILRPTINAPRLEGVSFIGLLKDPLILISAGAIMIANMGIAMLEPSLPSWMMDTMNAAKWQLGVAFLPASASYLLGASSFGPMGQKIGRWVCAMIGMIMIGVSLTIIPQAKSIKDLILPSIGLGFSIGMVDSSMMPTMGNLVDGRHVAVYGNVYAIADIAFCMGYSLGPSISGSLIKVINFSGMLYVIAIINIIFAPVLFILRHFEKDHAEQKIRVGGTKISHIKYIPFLEEHDF